MRTKQPSKCYRSQRIVILNFLLVDQTSSLTAKKSLQRLSRHKESRSSPGSQLEDIQILQISLVMSALAQLLFLVLFILTFLADLLRFCA